MQELAIWSQVSLAREKQVLSVLAGLSGTQPSPICEQTLVFAQTTVPEVKASKRQKQHPSYDQQQQQQLRLRYHKLLRSIDVRADGTSDSGSWKFRAEHAPEPGPQDIIKTRFVEEHSDAALAIERLRRPGLYRYANQYLLVGQRFIMGNIIVRLFRYLMPEAGPADDPITATTPVPQQAALVDPSGTLVFEAVVRVEDAGNNKMTALAKDELKSFATKMEGALVFKAVDRLSLDAQVRPA